MLPSESVISCVNVYGRLGRRRRVACRHWEQMYVVVGVGVVVVAIDVVGRLAAAAAAVPIRWWMVGGIFVM